AMRHARPAALQAFAHLINADDALLAAHTVVRLIAYLGYENPDVARPVIERMLSSANFETRDAGGQLAALAALQWGMADLLESVLSSDDVPSRKGAAEVCAHRLSNTSDKAIAQRAFEQFVNDLEPEVRKAAAEVASALRGERLRPIRESLKRLMESAAFVDALPQLLITLEHAPDRVDDLALECARRFIELQGADSGDIRTGAAGDARHIGELLIRAHAQSASRASRAQILDLLDQLLLIGAFGVADLVEKSER